MPEEENQEIKTLLQKNLALSEEISEDLKRVRKYIKWQQVWSTVRFLLIAIPIIIGFFYLPPLIKSYLESYSSFLK